jgi:hypothetical protein
MSLYAPCPVLRMPTDPWDAGNNDPMNQATCPYMNRVGLSWGGRFLNSERPTSWLLSIKGAHALRFSPVAKLSFCAVGIGKTPRTNMAFDRREVGLQGSWHVAHRAPSTLVFWSTGLVWRQYWERLARCFACRREREVHMHEEPAPSPLLQHHTEAERQLHGLPTCRDADQRLGQHHPGD